MQPADASVVVEPVWERYRTLNSSARIRHINHGNRRRRGRAEILCIPKLLISKLLRAAVTADFMHLIRRRSTQRSTDAGFRSKPESKLSYRSSEHDARAAEILQSNETSATTDCCPVAISDVTMLRIDDSVYNGQLQDIMHCLVCAYNK